MSNLQPIPLPPTRRIVGALPEVRRLGMLSYMIHHWQTHGDISAMKLGPRQMALLSHPDYVHQVLVKNQLNYQKGTNYDKLRLLLGNGLVTSEYELWRGQRRIMQPSFTPKNTLGFADMMVKVMEKILVRWEKMADTNTPLDMQAEMMRLTMSIIGEAMFSVDLSADEYQGIGRAFGHGFEHITDNTGRIFIPPPSWPTPRNRRFKRTLETLDSFIGEQIAHGRRHPNQPNLLNMLLSAQDEETGKGMDDKQLRDEVMTLFFAGFETTARTLGWAYYLLTQNPEAYAKMHAEVDEVLQGARPTVASLYQLPYTRMVADETLRLYPATGILARQAIAEDEIGGYHMPAGMIVAFSPHILHRHPDFWPNPEAFMPERFAPEKVAAMHKCAYIPFSTGPRVCIGNNFALLEIVVVLAMVAQKYEWRFPRQEVGAELHGTTRPEKPLYMTLHRR